MRKLVVGLFFFPLVVCAQVEQGRLTVEKLCSPEFAGRGYVKGGDSIAAEFIAAEFQSMGCNFFNNDPFQRFKFPVNTFPGVVECRINGEALRPGNEFVVHPSTGKTKIDSLVIYRVTTEDLLDQKSLRKKIVRSIDRVSESTPRVGYAFQFSLWKGDTLKKAQELAQSLGESMPIIELVEDKFTWSVSQEQSKVLKMQIRTKAIDPKLDRWVMNCRVDARMKNHTARNVIAYVPAKKKSKKYFVFSAHYDHLGMMGTKAYFPGANDNASGTALMLEMARHYAKNPSNVNMVFIAFAGEEVGLLGSKFYTENPLFPLEKIQFLFNLDIMGSGEEGATVVNATVFPEQFEILKSLNEKNQYLPKIGSRGKAANSDHYFFTEKGVPAFFMYTMGPNKHYHDVDDTYKALSFDKFNALVELLTGFEKVICWKR